MPKYDELLWPFGNLPNSYVVVDTETTGLFDGETAPDIVSIGLSNLKNGEIESTIEYAVRPYQNIEGHAQDVHGISWDKSQTQPELSDSWESICRHLSGKLIVAHNAVFDWRVLSSGAQKRHLELPPVEGIFCSQRAAQPWASTNGIKCSERGPSLDSLIEFLGIDNLREKHGGNHYAGVDAQLTATVVQQLRQTFQSSTPT